MTYDGIVSEALRETLKRPPGYIDVMDEKYGLRHEPPLEPLDPLFHQPQPPERTMGDWYAEIERDERKRYADVWQDAIGRIRGRHFRTREAVARHYGKSPSWACDLVRLMVKHRVFTAEELRELLPGKPGTPRKRMSGKKAYLARLDAMTPHDLEQVLYERDPELSLPLVVAMIRGRSFKSVTGLASHFFRPSYWGHAVGRFLEREGFLRQGEFRQCFSDRRGQAGAAVKKK